MGDVYREANVGEKAVASRQYSGPLRFLGGLESLIAFGGRSVLKSWHPISRPNGFHVIGELFTLERDVG